jgi:hypothetical protein
MPCDVCCTMRLYAGGGLGEGGPHPSFLVQTSSEDKGRKTPFWPASGTEGSVMCWWHYYTGVLVALALLHIPMSPSVWPCPMAAFRWARGLLPPALRGSRSGEESTTWCLVMDSNSSIEIHHILLFEQRCCVVCAVNIKECRGYETLEVNPHGTERRVLIGSAQSDVEPVPSRRYIARLIRHLLPCAVPSFNQAKYGWSNTTPFRTSPSFQHRSIILTPEQGRSSGRFVLLNGNPPLLLGGSVHLSKLMRVMAEKVMSISGRYAIHPVSQRIILEGTANLVPS